MSETNKNVSESQGGQSDPYQKPGISSRVRPSETPGMSPRVVGQTLIKTPGIPPIVVSQTSSETLGIPVGSHSGFFLTGVHNLHNM